jgi:hypothetical protein
MFDKLKNWFGAGANVNAPPTQSRPEPPPPLPPKKSRAPRKPKVVALPPELSAKDKATAAGEPYIAITKVEIDPNNINNGGFELDWNDKFLANLIRAGYKGKPEDTDEVIIDRWFQTVCRNIALEEYEQVQSDPANRGSDDLRPPVQKRNLGDGKVEIS